MRILFVVGHPAHVHLFRNVIGLLASRHHEIIVGAVEREVTTTLLDEFGLPFFRFGRVRNQLPGKALDLLPKDFALLRRARTLDPDLFVSTGSPYAAHVSALVSKPHLVFGDTESAGLITRLMLPFTDAVCTPASFLGELGPKHVRYDGYKELSYLHPRYYRPNPATLDEVGLSRDEPYVILRFAARDASHDLRDRGFHFADDVQRLSFVNSLERHARIVVTMDRGVDPRLASHQLRIKASKMHDILAYASLYVGEGATMAAEAGVLGVPWIFVSGTGRGFLREQQTRYGLGFWETSAESAKERAEELLSNPRLEGTWKAKQEAMLREKIDVARFIADFIDAWPDSLESSRHAARMTASSGAQLATERGCF